MSEIMQSVAVIGAGAWGTALATTIARNGVSVKLWAFETDVVETINTHHENNRFLPGIILDPRVSASSDPKFLTNVDAIFWVVPAQHLRSVSQVIASANILDTIPQIVCTKGIENKTNALMTEVLSAYFPNHPKAVLAGPNFAEEVAEAMPAATTISCQDTKIAERIANALRSKTLKVTTCDDVIGAQICGTAKNVLAIACGVLAGMGYGESTKAAAITAGFHEINTLVKAKGGTGAALNEFSGIGDLVLTCGSMKSRNMSLGYALGEGKSLESLLSGRDSIAEGVASAQSIHDLTKVLGIRLPLCEAVWSLLHNKGSIDQVSQAVFQ